MILSGKEINRQAQQGSIIISPFDQAQINPNSYNYRLDKFYTKVASYPKPIKENTCEPLLEIPEDGLILKPGVVYLGHNL